MHARVRLLALLLGLFLATSAFADDAAKNTTTSATDSGAWTNFAAPASALRANPALLYPLANAPAMSGSSESYPKGEIFGGYSFVRFSAKNPINGSANEHGVSGSIAGNVNRWLGLVADVGYERVKDLPPSASANMTTFLFGPRFSKRGDRWTPFVQTLFGAAHVHSTNSAPGGPSFFNSSFRQNGFAAALGGGLDLTVTKHVAWRLGQGEYLLTKFHDGVDNIQHNVRLSTGLVIRVGGAPPPPPPPPANHPPTISISPNPSKMFEGSGDKSVVQSNAADPDNDKLTYTWTATGGTIEGSGPEVSWNPAGLAPGKYTITGKVDDGRGGTASSSADVVIEARPNRPPTVTCAASPLSVLAGKPVTVTATGSDPDNDPLTYSFDASGGKVTATGSTGTFDTTGLAPGGYILNCHANDGRGGKADAKATVEVEKPVEQVQLEARLSLHSIYFPTAQPTVKNPNAGLLASQQRTMVLLAGDFKKYLTYKPDAHLILQGHADPRGGEEYNKLLSERRVARTKAFLVEQGVAADHIETQGLGQEQPMSADQVKDAVEKEQGLTPAQKKQLSKNAAVLALAGARRVDVTLSTTGQTSTRIYPFNAEDALNLINPKGTGTGAKKPAAKPAGKKPATTPAPKPKATKKK
jgi:outer membrane protein OmpA-like peptidoglycan-associated protein